MLLSFCCAHLGTALQMLPHGGFMALLLAVTRILFSFVDHVAHVGRVVEDILLGLHAPARWVAGQVGKGLSLVVLGVATDYMSAFYH
jgi:hypothetical protein